MHNLSTKKKGLQQVFHSFFYKEFLPKSEPSSRGAGAGGRKRKRIHTCSKHRAYVFHLYQLIYFIHIFTDISICKYAYLYKHIREKLS